MNIKRDAVEKEIQKRIQELTSLQKEDGSYRFRFQGSLMTDAFFIITCRALNIAEEEENIQLLAENLWKSQHKEGYWKAYDDEPNGHLSATIIAYTALLFSGRYSKNDEQMIKAKKFIISRGGLAKAHFMIRWMLSVHGLYPWSNLIYIPMTFLLLPTYQPINFFQFSAYARIHFVPMLLASNKKFTIHSKYTPNLDDLIVGGDSERFPSLVELEDSRSPLSILWKEMKRIGKFPAYLHQLGYQYAEKYIIDRIEVDGTLYSYASATFFMIYGLLAIGYQSSSPIIQKAIAGLSSLIDKSDIDAHLENSTSTVWDTGLISYSLQQAGISTETAVIQKSIQYLLSKQHTKKGDWQIHNPRTIPGGWGFSHINTNNPDNDDTSAVLRALTNKASSNTPTYNAWQRGTNFLLSMQNKDGGWGAFEKNTNWEILQYVPIENAKDAAVDPSTADLTGRVIEYLGNFVGLKSTHPHIKPAINWLLTNQESNGSWYGRWGVCYIYGTWAALTGLCSFERNNAISHSMKKAVNWLKSIQNNDGGWGESCRSSEVSYYVPLPFSTESQTAWALDALIAAGEWKSKAVTKGMEFLLHGKKDSRNTSYPTGIGLPGQFYIYYDSYNKIFPLLALAHYRKETNWLIKNSFI